MDRRLFLMMAFAGAAGPPPGPNQVGAPPLAVETPGPVLSGDPAFDAWAQAFIDRAIRDASSTRT